jgi:hypothetical protein
LLDGVISDLYAALYDLTKVASALNGKRVWEFKDRDEIYEHGRLGLASVLAKYGFSAWLPSLHDVEPSVLAKKESVNDVLKTVLELSKGSAENRTLIYLELRKIARDTTTRIILDLIEPVTQGEKSWAKFRKNLENFWPRFNVLGLVDNRGCTNPSVLIYKRLMFKRLAALSIPVIDSRDALLRLRCSWSIADSRVQYAYIENPKIDQTSLHQPKAPLT